MLITQGGLALRRTQNRVISKKNKSHVFHWKRSVVVLECCLQINLAAKTTWSKLLTCSTIILWYISSFECQGFKLSYHHRRATIEANPKELFQALMQQNVRKWQAPGRRAEKYGPTTIREAQIKLYEVLGWLHFNTAASWLVRSTSNRPPSSKQIEDRDLREEEF